jgi:hypothetical protein
MPYRLRAPAASSLAPFLLALPWFAGCSGDDTASPSGEHPREWRVALAHHDYTDFWGTGSPRFLVATDGGGGRVLRYVNGTWRPFKEGLGTLTAVDGIAADDLYVASEYVAYHFDGETWTPLPGQVQRLTSVYARAHDDVFFTGWSSLGGYVFHYDGASITPVAVPPVDGLFGMWGRGGHIVAVGEAGTVLHFDGADWSASTQSPNHLFDVWGAGVDDVYAVGSSGTVLHYDGVGWSPVGPGGAHGFLDVWGASGTDVYVVGNRAGDEAEGIIHHFDGVAWTEVYRDANDVRLSSVYGLPGTPVFAGGDGVLIESSGAGWKTLERSTSQSLQSVWAPASNDVYAAGLASELLRFDGDAWTRDQPGTRPEDLTCIRGGPSGSVYAVGGNGALARHDGTVWQTMAGPTSDTFTDVWELTPGVLLVTGTGGLIARHDGTQWILERQSDVGVTGETIRSLWAFAPDDVYAVRNLFNPTEISTRLMHYDGAAWTDVPFGIDLPEVDQLYALWGSPTGDVFATSTRWVGKFDGAAWEEMDPGITVDFNSVWGTSSSDVYVAGGFGVISHYDGRGLTRMTTGVEDDIRFLCGTAGGDVFAVTGAGSVLRYGRR